MSERRLDRDGVRLDRRGFLELSGAAAVSLAGCASLAQVPAGDVDTASLLFGPVSALPAPGGDFFPDAGTYHYLYVTFAGSRFAIQTDDAAWTELPVVPPEYDEPDLPSSPARGATFFEGLRNVPTWWDGDNYERPAFAQDVLASDQIVANTTTETTVFTADLDADALVEERYFELPVSGEYSVDNGTDTFTLRFYVGGTLVAAVQSVAGNESGAPILAELEATVRADGQSGTVKPYTEAVFANVNDHQRHDPVTIDTTQATSFEVTLQWDVADPNNTAEIDQAVLKQMS